MNERATEHPSTPKSPIRHAWLVALLLAGCGGKQANPMQVEETAADNEPAAHPRSGQVPPEKMDEINRNLERKRPIMSHCLALAVDAKELPKNSSGKLTIEIVISPGGKADNVKVVRATLASKTLDECVINHVKDIQFPDLPKPYETSYTYGFEAM